MSGNTGITGQVNRSRIRSAAVFLLVLGFAGATSVAAAVDSEPSAEAGAAAGLGASVEFEAYQLETMRLQRLVDASERVDRNRRLGPGNNGPERFSGAQAARTNPAPAPPPAPATEPSRSAPSDPVGPVPESCGDYSGNRATGCTLLLDAGFSIDQMSCLDNLWTKESGWNHRAQNPSSGAYGIPQALPGSKMASHGDDWQTNPATQIRWGLAYIKNRYSTPCGAWQFFQNNNWY